jgi:hypothetical protein
MPVTVIFTWLNRVWWLFQSPFLISLMFSRTFFVIYRWFRFGLLLTTNVEEQIFMQSYVLPPCTNHTCVHALSVRKRVGHWCNQKFLVNKCSKLTDIHQISGIWFGADTMSKTQVYELNTAFKGACDITGILPNGQNPPNHVRCLFRTTNAFLCVTFYLWTSVTFM